MKRSEKWRWPWLGGLVAALLLLVLALPHAIRTYHLQAGGRALEQALGMHDPLHWWYLGPREAQDPGALQRAIAHLQQAQVPYAQRLLGQAYVAQGDLLSGVRALEAFTALRPDHGLAQLELGAAYVWVDRRLRELEYLDLLDHLPGARVSAPDLEEEVTYPVEGWESEYLYPTTFGLPPEYGDRKTLFLHAGSQVTYSVPLTHAAQLRFGMGLDPRSLDWDGDGTTFEVFVDGERVFLEHLPIEVARGGWQERSVDLTDYAGHTVELSLLTTPGPVGDVTGDWAGWGEPRIEAPEADAYRQVVRGRPWLARWREAGVKPQDFVQAGELARRAERYNEALAWYGWGESLSPGHGDLWYYKGRVYEYQQKWPQALAAYERAIKLDQFRQAPQSSPYYRVGMIYQWRLETPRIEDAMSAYEMAIEAGDFASDWEAADSHYRRSEILRGQNKDASLYISDLRRAIEYYPRHSGAHASLGLALYDTSGDLEAAQVELQRALELAPNNERVYYWLGEVYRREELWDQARAMYQKSLQINPDLWIARARLKALAQQ
jgi:tetratricopeptide (TPR) repeat protein